jgi:hypothetical protein
MRKKLFYLLLAVVLLMALAAPAIADAPGCPNGHSTYPGDGADLNGEDSAARSNPANASELSWENQDGKNPALTSSGIEEGGLGHGMHGDHSAHSTESLTARGCD